MDRFCKSCRNYINFDWATLQDSLISKIDMNIYKNQAFSERCILCYASLLKLLEEDEHKMLKTILNSLEKEVK